MEDPPAAVITKAKRLEQLVQRVAQGEALESVCAELGLTVDARRLTQLQATYERGGRTWEALLDGRYGHPIRVSSAVREWLFERKRQDPQLTAPELVTEVVEQFGLTLSAGHINYLLRKVELTHPPGRPPKPPAAVEQPAEPAPSSQTLDNAGLFFPGGREGGAGGDASRGDRAGDRPPAVSGRAADHRAAGAGQ